MKAPVPERRCHGGSDRNADMRTRTLLSIALLGLLLWASRIQADGDERTEGREETSKEAAEVETPGESTEEDTEEDTEEAPKKEKTTEIEEERDVMVLHINNFDRALSENQYILIEFCK